MVAIAGYSIETPRLLLLSANKHFPDGLCNDEGQVGRYVLVQGAPQTSGRFDEEVRMFKGPPPEVSSEHYYRDRSDQGLQARLLNPKHLAPADHVGEHVAAQGHWGEVLREYMRDYVHWATLGALCEFLPRYDNAVTLDEETDRHGLRVAKFSYSQCENDTKLMKAATGVMEDLLKAAGAEEVMTIDRYAHLVGGCRMATNNKDGVVDANQRTFAVPNLYLTDGSVLPTQGSANPALTIMALAARCADHLISEARCGMRPRWRSGDRNNLRRTPTQSRPINLRPMAPRAGTPPPW